MSDIRCPRRECRSRKKDAVSGGFLISDTGGVLETGQAGIANHFTYGSGRITKFGQTRTTINLAGGPYRSVPPHFRCVCGHRYRHVRGTNQTLKVPDGYRLYDAFEVAWLIKGEPAGWRHDDDGTRREAA